MDVYFCGLVPNLLAVWDDKEITGCSEMMSDLVHAVGLELLQFNLGGQFMWLIIMVFLCFCARLLARGPADAWVQSAPSTLLSMGVLGTFAGIVVGLSAFDSPNIDESLNEVLAGLSTAFYSSLLAMALSLVFKCVQVRSVQRLRDRDDSDGSDDIAEKLLVEMRSSVKQLRQINSSTREHSEYLIHMTNAVADGGDRQGLLGAVLSQRTSFEQAMLTVVEELSALREQGDRGTDALDGMHDQLRKHLDASQFASKDFKKQLDGVQHILMTLPNRRDFQQLFRARIKAASASPKPGSTATRTRA